MYVIPFDFTRETDGADVVDGLLVHRPFVSDVERVARGIYAAYGSAEFPMSREDWPRQGAVFQERMRRLARAAIAAMREATEEGEKDA